jgi:hypothetical protein
MCTGFATAAVDGSKIILIKKGRVPIEITEKTIDNRINKKYNPMFALYALR